MLPLSQIIHEQSLNFHCYADDTQLYLSTSPSTQISTVSGQLPSRHKNPLPPPVLTAVSSHHIMKFMSSWIPPCLFSHKSIPSPSLPFFNFKTFPDRPSLSDSVAETVTHAFIISCLDYCNGVLFGVPSKTLDRL